jgi:Type II secretion system (T2SS), protein E, N-terminal domain
VSGTDTTRSAAAKGPPGVAAPVVAGGRDGFLSDVIVELGFATRETVEQAVRAARSPGTTVSRVLLDMNAISEEQLAQATAERYGIDYIDLEDFEVDPAAANLIDAGLAKRYRAVPVAFLGDRLLVAMTDPADAMGVNDIAVVTRQEVRPAVAPRPALDALLEALPLEGSPAPTGDALVLQDDVPEEPEAPAPPAPKSLEASELRSELDALKRQLAGAQAKVRGQAAPGGSEAAESPAVVELRARLAEAEAELDAARDRVREAKEVSAELETLREALAAAEAGLTAQAIDGGAASGETRELRARLAQAESERDIARAQVREAQRLRERVDTGRVERDEARERAREVEVELRRIRAEVEGRSGELASLRRQLGEAQSELVRVRAEVEARGAELAAMRTRAESAEAEAESALRRAEEADRDCAQARLDVEEARRLAEEGTDARAEGARRALAELREENERERERWAVAERDLCQTLGVEKTRRAELEERLSEVEGSAFAAERAFEELRLAQGRMREALRSLAEPEPTG